MKILNAGFLTVLVASTVMAIAFSATPQANSFTGEIMDSQCAQMGSHAAMMKQEGAKNAKECSDACVKMGGKYVLYDAGTKTTYQLDDQGKAKEFSGQKVTVTGDYDKAGQTIHVSNIKPQ
jgi:hypothetical protein